MRFVQKSFLLLGLLACGFVSQAGAQDFQNSRHSQLRAERDIRVSQLQYLDRLQRENYDRYQRAIDGGIGLGTAAVGYTMAVRYRFAVKARIEAIDQELNSIHWSQ